MKYSILLNTLTTFFMFKSTLSYFTSTFTSKYGNRNCYIKHLQMFQNEKNTDGVKRRFYRKNNKMSSAIGKGNMLEKDSVAMLGSEFNTKLSSRDDSEVVTAQDDQNAIKRSKLLRIISKNKQSKSVVRTEPNESVISIDTIDSNGLKQNVQINEQSSHKEEVKSLNPTPKTGHYSNKKVKESIKKEDPPLPFKIEKPTDVILTSAPIVDVGYLTTQEFSSLPISVNTKKAISDVLKYK